MVTPLGKGLPSTIQKTQACKATYATYPSLAIRTPLTLQALSICKQTSDLLRLSAFFLNQRS